MPTTLEPKAKDQIEEETFVQFFGHNLSRQTQEQTESSPDRKQIVEMMVTFCLLAYQKSKQKIGRWELPNENSTPSDSVKAYRAYRIAKATNDLFTLCLEEISKLNADQVTIDRESQIAEAKTKLDRLIAWFEKWWSVGVTHAWQTSEGKPVR